MRTFTDKGGREWTLDITFAAAMRMKSMAGVDLLADDQAGIFELIGSGGLAAYATICNCLYACVQPQAKQKNVSDEDFGSQLGAAQMARAAEAFVEELIDFFRELRPPLGEALRTLWTKAQASRSKEADIVSRAMQRPEIDLAISEAMSRAESQLNQTIGQLSGKSPASAASILEG